MRQRWITLTANGWHDVITGYIREGQIEQALEGIEQVQQAGVSIQGWLYDMVVYALCDADEPDEALRIMQDQIAAGNYNVSHSVWYYVFDNGCKLLHVSASNETRKSICSRIHSMKPLFSYGGCGWISSI